MSDGERGEAHFCVHPGLKTGELEEEMLDVAIAAFCTIWFDDVTPSAYFEPVATVPAHRRRGLGRAVMTEGLRRLQRLGATTAFVGGLNPAANALYRSVIGPDYELYESWVKEW